MNTDDMDWIFDSSREGRFPKGGIWRLAVKYWVLGSILATLAAVAAAIALRMCSKDVPLELAFGVVMAVMIILFCCFLVWMTYRCGARRNRERKDGRRRSFSCCPILVEEPISMKEDDCDITKGR